MSKACDIFDKKYDVFDKKKRIDCWGNIIKSGIKSVIMLKKDLIFNQCTMKYI